MAARASPLPAVGVPVHSSANKLSDTESDDEHDDDDDNGFSTVTPKKKKKTRPTILGTPAVPSRYPNLETPTQVSRRVRCVRISEETRTKAERRRAY